MDRQSSRNADVPLPEIAGYRLLREIAGSAHAEALVAKTLATTGRVTPEAQTTLAAAARRDATGAYAAALVKALAAAPDAQKPALAHSLRKRGVEVAGVKDVRLVPKK